MCSPALDPGPRPTSRNPLGASSADSKLETSNPRKLHSRKTPFLRPMPKDLLGSRGQLTRNGVLTLVAFRWILGIPWINYDDTVEPAQNDHACKQPPQEPSLCEERNHESFVPFLDPRAPPSPSGRSIPYSLSTYYGLLAKRSRRSGSTAVRSI